MEELAVRVVDSITRNYRGDGSHRAAHAKGFCVSGTFIATPEAAALTRAIHMQGATLPVTVRFSNGSGSLTSADYHIDPRGMAVRFHLPGGESSDVVALSQRTFFVRTPEDFAEFTDARQPDPATGRPDPNAIGDFLIRHPEAEAAFTELLGTAPPKSYATVAYNSLHAFRWVDSSDVARFVRYRFAPETEETLEREEAKALGRDYLREEMASRLAAGPAVFTFEVVVGEKADDPTDPTVEWPASRKRIAAGRLELTAMVDDQEGDCERQVFDPTRLTDGIEPSGDLILAFRPKAYDVSASRRLGS
jgi:catalase